MRILDVEDTENTIDADYTMIIEISPSNEKIFMYKSSLQAKKILIYV